MPVYISFVWFLSICFVCSFKVSAKVDEVTVMSLVDGIHGRFNRMISSFQELQDKITPEDSWERQLDNHVWKYQEFSRLHAYEYTFSLRDLEKLGDMLKEDDILPHVSTKISDIRRPLIQEKTNLHITPDFIRLYEDGTSEQRELKRDTLLSAVSSHLDTLKRMQQEFNQVKRSLKEYFSKQRV